MANIPICIDCGLTVNDAGSLIVNTGGATWAYDCTKDHATGLFCDPDDGVLKVNDGGQGGGTHWIADSDRQTILPNTININAIPNIDIEGDEQDIGTPLTRTITNPSNCRPMKIQFSWALSHFFISKGGPSDMRIEGYARMTLTGDINDTGEVHQIWRHRDANADSNARIEWDASGSQKTNTYMLKAGGSFKISVQLTIKVPVYNAPQNTQIRRPQLEWTVIGHTI